MDQVLYIAIGPDAWLVSAISDEHVAEVLPSGSTYDLYPLAASEWDAAGEALAKGVDALQQFCDSAGKKPVRTVEGTADTNNATK